ncbi:hypothetical protein CapIbe_011638 [Capra ibex]
MSREILVLQPLLDGYLILPLKESFAQKIESWETPETVPSRMSIPSAESPCGQSHGPVVEASLQGRTQEHRPKRASCDR